MCTGYVENRRYQHMVTSRRLTFSNGKHVGICSSHLCPSQEHWFRNDEIIPLSQSVADALGIKEGPLSIQLLIGEEGIIVNEAAARIGGGFEDIMSLHLTGFDIIEAVLNGVLGQSQVTSISPVDGSRYVSCQLLFAKEGVIDCMTPLDEVNKLPFILSSGYNYTCGCTLRSICDATARLGHCIVSAGSSEELISNVSRLYDVMSVTDETGDNLLIRGYAEKAITL
jgi:hypothetical protein